MPKLAQGRHRGIRRGLTAAPTQQALSIAQGWKSSLPIILRHPKAAELAVKHFLKGFVGQTMYAVKANSSDDLLQILYNCGIQAFDVASIQEIRKVRNQFPDAILNFMTPVKNEHAIREAYLMHNVRSFALDSQHELDKILMATGVSEKELTLCVRVDVGSKSCKLPLTKKYGTQGEEAVGLLQMAREFARKLGICFHAGSQTMDPEDFVRALHQVHELADSAGIVIDVVDVGGGFPVRYPGMEPPPLRDYFTSIHMTILSLPLFCRAELWAEPGRALCAEFHSVIAHVDAVRDGCVYGNDGIHGNLSDAGRLNWPFEAILLRNLPSEKELCSFQWYGPCGDSEDLIPSIMLPEDVTAGDHVWFRTIGAYGTALSTAFCSASGLQAPHPLTLEL